MPIDSENIKKAIDSFVDDDFVTSKEILKKEIQKGKNDWLKTKLDLEKDPLDVKNNEEGDNEDNGEE